MHERRGHVGAESGAARLSPREQLAHLPRARRTAPGVLPREELVAARVQKPRSADLHRRAQLHEARGAPPRGPSRSSATSAASISCSVRWASTAASRSSFVGKRRKIVADTDARHARRSSVTGASMPCSAKTSRAASSTRRRLRSSVGAKHGRHAASTAYELPFACVSIDSTCRLRIPSASTTSPAARNAAPTANATWKPRVSASGRPMPCDEMRRVRLAASVESTARPSAPPICCDVLKIPRRARRLRSQRSSSRAASAARTSGPCRSTSRRCRGRARSK